MQARLKVVQDNANLKQVKLLPITVIGRAADCQLKIASTQVSRKHCRITVTDQTVLVEDLNSANGTYVNQERIPSGKLIPVTPGTTLHIGPAAFVVDYTPPVNLETMPTTVIKSSELPFLKGLGSSSTVMKAPAAPPLAEPKAADVPVSPEPLPENFAATDTVTPASYGSDVLAAELPSLPVPPESIPAAEPCPPAERLEACVPEFLPPGPVVVEAAAVEAAAPAPPEPVIESSPPAIVIEAASPAIPGIFPTGSETIAPAVLPVEVIAVPTAPAVPFAPVAKPVPIVAPPIVKTAPVAAKPAPPTVSDQTVTMFDSGQETIAAPPPSAPAAAGFDFLAPPAESPATAFDTFNFGAPAAPVAAPVAPAASKPAPAKKSLFGLFGRKDKPGSPTTAAPAPTATQTAPPAAEIPAPVIPEPVAAPPASADDPFAFLK